MQRTRPELAEHLQEQANAALRHHAKEGNLKWVSLLMWAGANPRSNGPVLEYPDDPDMFTTAFAEAFHRGRLEVRKRMKPDPQRDGLASLLKEAAFSAHTDVLAYLLKLGAHPNDKPNGGSSALDAAIRHLGWEDLDAVLCGGRNRRVPAWHVPHSRDAIRLLIEHGALWNPGELLNECQTDALSPRPRRDGRIGRLLVKHRACDDETLQHLLCTPRMQAHMAQQGERLKRFGLTLDGRRRLDVGNERDTPPSPRLLARYDRERLYQELWSEPAQTVAKRYGISDVALAKICRQLQIPRPSRGSWAKKTAGAKVGARPKLPALG